MACDASGAPARNPPAALRRQLRRDPDRPLRQGQPEVIEQLLVRFAIETITVDMALAQRAAAVRARTSLSGPDAFALATAVQA